MRRYDEFQRFSALVPDELVLKPTGTKPSTEPEEADGVLPAGRLDEGGRRG